ncbi:MAG TPA: hypothetical protein VLJ11_10590 [Bryobacteraceae bacterium]|nr:hypothetical protein [Bryobacteraceae bacterium]
MGDITGVVITLRAGVIRMDLDLPLQMLERRSATGGESTGLLSIQRLMSLSLTNATASFSLIAGPAEILLA